MHSQSFTIQHRVAFHETDMAGAVHFSNFFRYAELVEHALWAHLGHDLTAVHHGLAWPRVETQCTYHRPAHFGDLLDLTIRILKIGESSLTYQFEVSREATRLAQGTVVIVHARRNEGGFEKSPIPAPLRRRLSSFLVPEA